MEKDNSENNRRNFLKFSLLAGGATLVGLTVKNKLLGDAPVESGKKVKVLTADGKLVEVDSSHLSHHKFPKIEIQSRGVCKEI